MIYPKSERQAKFSVASIIERMVVKDFYLEKRDFQIAEFTAINSAEQHDCVLISAGTEFVTEIKIRSCNINSYPDNWVELQKLIPLYSEGQKAGKQTWFILSFKDGICIWNINDMMKRMMDGSAIVEYRTYVSNSVTANAEHTTKPCLTLSRDYATIYKYNRGDDFGIKQKAEAWYSANEHSDLIYSNWKNPKLK